MGRGVDPLTAISPTSTTAVREASTSHPILATFSSTTAVVRPHYHLEFCSFGDPNAYEFSFRSGALVARNVARSQTFLVGFVRGLREPDEPFNLLALPLRAVEGIARVLGEP